VARASSPRSLGTDAFDQRRGVVGVHFFVELQQLEIAVAATLETFKSEVVPN
jgi:hypothetical protein